MLLEYKTKYTKALLQFLVVDHNGFIIESDDALFKTNPNQNIVSIHPFFESLVPILDTKDETYNFSCIHLNLEEKTIVTDIDLQTFKDGTLPLITIQDLTAHYTNFQATAQVRNESVIEKHFLDLKNKNLKEKENFKNSFIANFSHELRDPLTGIITFSDILEKTKLNEEQQNYLKILKSSSSFLKKMIDDILDISKIESGQIDLMLEPFNFKEFLEEINFNYKIKTEQKDLEYIYNFDDNLPETIIGDAKRLQQIISNLIDNAIKFTEKGSITLNVSLNQIRAQKASIHFEVIDTGVGISEEHKDKIFTSFTQINSEKPNKGTGIGLSIVKHLVELKNSKVTVKSKLGKGSTFSTNLSFALQNKTSNLKAESTEEVQFKSDKKYNILLVEDSEISQLSILKILASQGHFFLDIATNPDDVLKRISNPDNEVNLILMDIKLKEHNGDEIAKQIRSLKDRQLKKIPIIALTAKVFKEDLKQYKKAGINDVIKKPFERKVLLEKMAQYLN